MPCFLSPPFLGPAGEEGGPSAILMETCFFSFCDGRSSRGGGFCLPSLKALMPPSSRVRSGSLRELPLEGRIPWKGEREAVIDEG